jgi:hypothetical protein
VVQDLLDARVDRFVGRLREAMLDDQGELVVPDVLEPERPEQRESEESERDQRDERAEGDRARIRQDVVAAEEVGPEADLRAEPTAQVPVRRFRAPSSTRRAR